MGVLCGQSQLLPSRDKSDPSRMPPATGDRRCRLNRPMRFAERAPNIAPDLLDHAQGPGIDASKRRSDGGKNGPPTGTKATPTNEPFVASAWMTACISEEYTVASSSRRRANSDRPRGPGGRIALVSNHGTGD